MGSDLLEDDPITIIQSNNAQRWAANAVSPNPLLMFVYLHCVITHLNHPDQQTTKVLL